MSGLLQPLHLVVPLLLFGIPAILVLWVVPLGIICRKAGFSPWLTLLNCVPFGNTVLLYLLAFAGWKRRPMFVPGPAPDQSPEAAVAKAEPQIAPREA